MSSQAICETQVKDTTALVETVRELLKDKATVSVVPASKSILAENSREIIISITGNGIGSHTGYYRNKEGNYTLIYNRNNANALNAILPQKNSKGVADPVTQLYAKKKVLSTLKSINGRLHSTVLQQNGTIKMKIKVTQ